MADKNYVTTSRCAEASFGFMGEDGGEYIEGVGIFKYLGRPLDRLDDNWRAVQRNIRNAHQLWGHLGKLLWREGEDTFV